jgi:hypothetical protein
MKSELPESKPDERLDMVGWYDPGQLIRTGIEVAISTLFGRHSDYRLTEALTTGGDRPPSDKPYFDHTFHYKVDGEHYVPDPARQCDELWIDYVGDVGDGWDSTYSVAHYLSRPELTFVTSTQGGEIRRRSGLSDSKPHRIQSAADRSVRDGPAHHAAPSSSHVCPSRQSRLV